jgi:4-amino-4-deoxy-L-arabinose transferase-like glycosyltransferase
VNERLGQGIKAPRPSHAGEATATWVAAPSQAGSGGTLVLLGLALLLAVPAGGIALSRGFDGLYGQDAYAYFDYGSESVRQSLLHLQPLQPFFWPPGYPILVALAALLIGARPVAGQLVSLSMGALVPVFTAMLTRELFPRQRGLALLAGLLVALCGQLWQSSIVVMADTTGLALATFSAWALVRYTHSQSPAWLIGASAALAYAMLARWIYGLVAVPFAAYALWALPRARPWRATLHALAGLAVAAALLVPVLGPPLLGLLNHPSDPATFAGNLQVYTWSPLNAFRRDFFTADGHLEYAQRNGVYYAEAPFNLAFFGPLLAPWSVLGVWAAVREWARPGLLLIVGWAAIVYAFHAGAPWQNFRFTLAYLPPLAILVAGGIVWTWRHVERRLGVVVVACAVLGLSSMVAGGMRLGETFVDRKNDDLALARWVEAQAPPGAQLLSFGPTLTLRHYTSLPTFDLFDLSPSELNGVLATGAPTYVLLDEQNVQDQWLNQAPSDNFLRLRADPGLQRLGEQGSYTLYRVSPR